MCTAVYALFCLLCWRHELNIFVFIREVHYMSLFIVYLSLGCESILPELRTNGSIQRCVLYIGPCSPIRGDYHLYTLVKPSIVHITMEKHLRYSCQILHMRKQNSL